MTTVRIAHAEPRPGKLPHGGFETRGHLVVLADDAGHRAVPIWLWLGDDLGAGHLSELLELSGQPASQVLTAGVPQELTARLLGAARARVTGVDIDMTDADAAELSPEVTVARIGLACPAGIRQVTAGLGLALALAAAASAPVRLADAVMDRLAVPAPDGDLLTPFLDRKPPTAPALPGRQRWPLATLRGARPRYEPRNLDFADGLDRWDLDSWPGPEQDQPEPEPDGEPDYAAAAEGSSAVLFSAAPRPAGSAALVQAIFADDYRGAAVAFSGEIRTEALSGQGGLRLEILRHWRPGREDHGLTIAGRRRAWSRYEITARIPPDADLIRFGIGLTGSGRIVLRSPGLRIAGTP
ncbi:MAG TPA: hypothetical protein VF070_43565 [Streptosporangiaceae bacterium]